MREFSLVDFCAGTIAGAFLALIFSIAASDALRAEAIKAHQEGKIECATVGGEFICREVQK